jgi:hypothetical protein
MKIIAYQNTKDFAVSTDVVGLGRVTLWGKGDRILDKEGNPIVCPGLAAPHVARLGILPVYAEEAVVSVPSPVKESVSDPDLVPNPITTIKEVDVNIGSTSSMPANADIFNESSAPKQIVQFDKATNEWVYLPTQYRSNNPANVKKHITGKFGKEVLDKVEWLK